MDFFETFVLDVSQGVCLVPTAREDIEGNFSADGEGETIVCVLFLKDFDEGLADFMDLQARRRQVNAPLTDNAHR